MKEIYNYEDGFGGELSAIINHANIQLTTSDTVEGDSVTMQLSLSETRQLIKALESATQHAKDD
ncbi:hypothetical protein [Lactiplantibacillus plantarum]|uniref:hypothetical protein n=1 Tax=Lactiplantibacillus plantarum TaxID=1590 RepID=UPI001BA883C5|nr:hypothetical protein [Lactiplantibacillus plantarum]MBS0937073.1 hypothetical protein [Lactiplantibacillus plantarum]MBS0944124.1 hypothetical protein [Lactiplantibacillus plantarum]